MRTIRPFAKGLAEDAEIGLMHRHTDLYQCNMCEAGLPCPKGAKRGVPFAALRRATFGFAGGLAGKGPHHALNG